MNRMMKRLVISLIYLAIFSFIVWFIYSLIKPEETCTDGKKNQNEEGVDCGGVCGACKRIDAQPLVTKEAGIVPSGVSGQYDFYGVIVNPNNIYGSQKFDYKFAMKDSAGKVLFEKNGTSFILPGEKKYIIENNIKSDGVPTNAEITIANVQWTEFTDYYAKPDLEIVNKSYNVITSGVGFAEAKGLLKNKSPYDFDQIRISIILKDASGKVVALNSTDMRTVKSKEERDFRTFWPTRFPGDVQNVEAQIEVNIFSMQAFLKR